MESKTRTDFEVKRPRNGLTSPRIGVTAALREVTEYFAHGPSGYFVRTDLDYVEGVLDAGGLPVVIPPTLTFRAAETLLDGLDGLLLSGGPDLDPAYYGEEPVPELGTTIPGWDALELGLLGLALERGMPIFGICRGMQILNAALGGTLYQDVPSQLGAGVIDHWQTTPKREIAHEVEVLDDTYLAELMDHQTVGVNSYHHQGIKGLAGALTVAARSADGMIEAVESRDFSDRWLVGVQWHPEGLRNSGHRNLFEAHVYAAEHHASRSAAA